MVRVVLVAFALLLAAAAGWMVKLYLSAQRDQLVSMAAALKPPPAPTQGTEVLVVRDGVPVAGVLTSGSLRWEFWPDSGVDSHYITRKARPDAIEKLAGAAARQPLFPGEPVTEEKLVTRHDGGFLAATLADGGRAVAVKVDEATGLSGLILPGDRVDVILTHEIPAREDDGRGGVRMVKRFVSEVIAHNLRVAAIDQEIRHDDKAATKPSKTVILGVDATQAERVALGRVMGTLSLSLRSAFGGEAPESRGHAYTSATDISAALGEQAAPPPPAVAAEKAPEHYTVTVYHGLAPQTVALAR